jgi:hypothetical protein
MTCRTRPLPVQLAWNLSENLLADCLNQPAIRPQAQDSDIGAKL